MVMVLVVLVRGNGDYMQMVVVGCELVIAIRV